MQFEDIKSRLFTKKGWSRVHIRNYHYGVLHIGYCDKFALIGYTKVEWVGIHNMMLCKSCVRSVKSRIARNLL